MKNKSVLVIGNDHLTTKMFRDEGFHVIHGENYKKPDFVCWTGGEDVSPHLYGEQTLSCTTVNPRRDAKEEEFWKRYEDPDVFKVGICRGGQFLNVMNKGAMWQDVDGHGGSHEATDLFLEKGKKFVVTSTHHQMMIPSSAGDVLLIAKRAHQFRTANPERNIATQHKFDTEVVWYSDSKSLCFQPHPEYPSAFQDCRNYFFNLIRNLY